MNEPTRDPSSNRRRVLVLGSGAGLSLASLGLTGCAGTPPQAGPTRTFEAPRVAVGDRWTYREINRYNGLALAEVDVTVTAAAPLTCSVKRRRSETTAGEIPRFDMALEEIYRSPWTVDHEPTYDMTLDFAEPMPVLPQSLRVGASSRDRTRYTVRGYSGTYRWSQHLEAVALERIATPAGSFDCLRVRRLIWFEHPDVFRIRSARVDNAWYAPEVNRWVRREWTGDYLHENSMDLRGGKRLEDWVRWELLRYEPARPSPAG